MSQYLFRKNFSPKIGPYVSFRTTYRQTIFFVHHTNGSHGTFLRRFHTQIHLSKRKEECNFSLERFENFWDARENKKKVKFSKNARKKAKFSKTIDWKVYDLRIITLEGGQIGTLIVRPLRAGRKTSRVINPFEWRLTFSPSVICGIRTEF